MHKLQAFLFHQEGVRVVNAKILGELLKLFKMVVKGAAAFQLVYKALLEIPRRAKIREIRKHRGQYMRIVPPLRKLKHRNARRRHTVIHRQNPHQRRFARHIRFNRLRLVILEVSNIQPVQLKQHKRVGRHHLGKFQKHRNHVAARQRILAVAVHVHAIARFKKHKPAFSDNQFNGRVYRTICKSGKFHRLLL